MPRPKNKDELLKVMEAEFATLCAILEQTPNAILSGDFKAPLRDNSRDKNARDVLIHLYEWHKMCENFIHNNVEFDGTRFTPKPNKTPFLPAPYNWKTYPKLNIALWQKHQDTSLEVALELLQNSHKNLANLTEQFSNDELFNKGHFAFSGGTNLGSYIISSTSSHYIWAIKQLKMGLK